MRRIDARVRPRTEPTYRGLDGGRDCPRPAPQALVTDIHALRCVHGVGRAFDSGDFQPPPRPGCRVTRGMGGCGAKRLPPPLTRPVRSTAGFGEDKAPLLPVRTSARFGNSLLGDFPTPDPRARARIAGRRKLSFLPFRLISHPSGRPGKCTLALSHTQSAWLESRRNSQEDSVGQVERAL